VSFVDGSISTLPWCEQPLSSESRIVSGNLRLLNESGFLTINSQPRVNGASSSDEDVGWGVADGFVFQKAYLEFFCSPSLFRRLVDVINDYPSLSFHAMTADGREMSNVSGSTVSSGGDNGDSDNQNTNIGSSSDNTTNSRTHCSEHVNAVTWGVFPGREIIQPTVVDPTSFATWKDEAFNLWLTQWGQVYEREVDEEEKRSYGLIKDIYDTFWLVNVVDND